MSRLTRPALPIVTKFSPVNSPACFGSASTCKPRASAQQSDDVPAGGWFPKKTKRVSKSQRKKTPVVEWQLIGTDGEASLYYHPGTITRVDNETKKVWTRQVKIPRFDDWGRGKGKTAPYSLDLFAIRCYAGEFALLKVAHFDEHNNLTDTERFPEQWDSITPLSFLDSLRKKVCA